MLIEWETPEGEQSLSCRDVPLPSFITAVENLAPVVLEILHLPSDYIHGLKPTGVTVSNKQEVDLVTIVATKELTDCNSPFNISTPLRFLECPKEEGSYSPPLNDKQVAAVEQVLLEAKGYVQGHRAQGQLPLDVSPDTAGESEAGDEGLDFREDKDNA